MYALFHILLLASFGALNYYFVEISEDTGGGIAHGLIVINILQVTTMVVSVASIVSLQAARQIFARSLPIVAICGLAALSAVWSPDPAYTLRKAILLSTTGLLAMAVVGRYGPAVSIRMIVTCMTIACGLSIVAVFVSPTSAVHQADDAFQSVHAGLWRGVLAHKVSLGIFSGLLVALGLCSHRSIASAPLRMAAVIFGSICLVGSGSVTGIVTTAIFCALHAFVSFIARKPPPVRRSLGRLYLCFLAVACYVFFSGHLDRLAVLLGRSADLTGRANYWPHVIGFVEQYGRTLGFGYASGYRFIGPLLEAQAGTKLTEAHNGLLELLVAFGYLGTAVVLVLLAILMMRALRLLERATGPALPLAVFPVVALSANLLTSYAESIILMPTGIWTTTCLFAVAVLGRLENLLPEHAASLEQDSGSDGGAVSRQSPESARLIEAHL